jgi:hypothetical protein
MEEDEIGFQKRDIQKKTIVETEISSVDTIITINSGKSEIIEKRTISCMINQFSR